MVEREIIEWQRWLLYLLVGPPLVTWVFLTKNSALRIVAVVAMLIFVQDTLTSRRMLFGISVGPSSMILFAALAAHVLERGRFPGLGGYGWLWAGFLFFATIGVTVGSIGTGLLINNIQQFQLFYAEGFLFFLLGHMAFRNDEEIERFFRYFVFVGLGVALVHFFEIASGHGLRAAAGEFDPHLTGGFNAPNALGSFYVIAIPINLMMALRGRLSGFLRLSVLLSLALMGSSLILSASRGGLLFTGVMSVVAVLWARAGIGRALLAGAIGLITLGAAYGFFMTFLPTAAKDALVFLETEGLETTRLSTWEIYLAMILDHPFGVGHATENVVRIVSEYGTDVVNAHSIYLNIAVRTGILGLAIFLVMAATLVRHLLRALSRAAAGRQQQALMYLFLAVVGFLVAGVAEPIYSLGVKLNQFFWLVSGISVAASARALASDRVLESDVVSQSVSSAPGSASDEAGDGLSPWSIRR